MATEIPTGNASREVQETIAGAREGLRQVLDRGSELKDAAIDSATRLRDAAMTRGRNAVTTMERLIQERPFTVLGGVFAGGLILGFLLSRR